VPPEMMLRDGIAKSTSGAEAGTCRHPGTRTSLPDAQPKGIAANQQAAYAFAANVLPVCRTVDPTTQIDGLRRRH
jgi:hypothetical protein